MCTCTLPSNSALDGGGWSRPRPGRFTAGEDLVATVQEAEWGPGSVWTGAKYLAAPSGFAPRTVQPRSQSLYRLSYRGQRGGKFNCKSVNFQTWR
jgi:hypothetical protein